MQTLLQNGIGRAHHPVPAKYHNSPPRPPHHQCLLCQSRFTSQTDLLLHTASVHNNDSNVTNGHQQQLENGEVAPPLAEEGHRGGGSTCNVCNKTFLQPGQLAVHVRTHETRQWDCTTCGKKFTTKYFLKKHRRLHTGGRPY